MKFWNSLSLVVRIIIGMIIGSILALIAPVTLAPIAILGTLFVGALKAVAPILVFFLIIAAISQHKAEQKTNIKSIIVLYLLGTFLAGLVAVIASFMFPVVLNLKDAATGVTPPSDVTVVIKNLLMNVVSNPVKALLEGNYIGVLSFAILIGLALKNSAESTKMIISDLSHAVSQVVKWIINLAPFGILGLVFDTIVTSGLEGLTSYGRLLALLVGVMFFVALVINPIIAFFVIKQNPYKLVLRCLRVSGITAFFTRSSAANIPVNMNLCEELNLDPDTYSVSIPLGATINMAGAAITISILTLAAVHTLNIPVDLPTAIILSILSAVSACGASGVAGGSLLLIPLACSLFGIPNEIAMQVVGVGFVIGVIQDSCETALNSSTDVLFTAIADFAEQKKQGKIIKF